MKTAPKVEGRSACPACDALEAWARGEADCLLAILFGSMAAGRALAASDVDLALWWRKPLDAPVRESVNRAVTARVSRPLDIIDLRRANGVLLREILKLPWPHGCGLRWASGTCPFMPTIR